MSDRNDGVYLEKVVENLCKQLTEGAKVQRNIKKLGKLTGILRQIDVLIEGKLGAFPISICVDAKDYNKPVDVNVVSKMVTNLEDVGADIGVIVCPADFTDGAKKMAIAKNIQLLIPISPDIPELVKLMAPVQCIMPYIENFALKLSHRVKGPFEMPVDLTLWRFKVEDNEYNLKQLVLDCWNKGMIDQKKGKYNVPLHAMTLYNIENPDVVQYAEIELDITIGEKYYLGLIPLSGFKKSDGAEALNIALHVDQIEKEWQQYDSLKDMQKVAIETPNQPDGIKNLVVHPHYTMRTEGVDFTDDDNNIT